MKSDNWWAERKAEANRTKGMKEGILVREELAKEFYSEEMYGEAANMYEQAAIVAAQFPETLKYSDKYFDKVALMNKKAERAKSGGGGGSYFSKLLLFISFLGAISGIVMLTPNFTGGVIAESGVEITNWLGMSFLALGMVFAAWYILRK